MDNITVENIFKLVKHSNGIKASEIAKQLGISRKEVNKILYGRLAKICVRDDQYLWYCGSGHSLIETSFSDSCFAKMENAFSNADFTVEDLETFLNKIENEQD